MATAAAIGVNPYVAGADPQVEQRASEVGGQPVVVVAEEEGPGRIVGKGGGDDHRHRRSIGTDGPSHVVHAHDVNAVDTKAGRRCHDPVRERAGYGSRQRDAAGRHWSHAVGRSSSSDTAATRAGSSFKAITAGRLYSTRRHLFGPRRWWVRRAYENLWPFADAWSATCTLMSLDRGSHAASVLPSFFEGLAAYHRAGGAAFESSEPVGFESSVVAPLGGGGEVYFDDNAWLGLALMCHHELLGDERALLLARRLFAFVVSGWSSDASWSHPGGIRWKQPVSNRSRNTCANGPAAELAVLIHNATGDQSALEWSVRIYDWVRSTLLTPDGLYVDQIAPDGTLRPEIWSYNQGTMIGAGVLLHRTTGDESYLAQATATASASVGRFGLPVLVSQDACFNAVFFRNLFLLDQLSPDPRLPTAGAGLRGRDVGRAPGPPNRVVPWGALRSQQFRPLVEIYALLAGAPAHP